MKLCESGNLIIVNVINEKSIFNICYVVNYSYEMITNCLYNYYKEL